MGTTSSAKQATFRVIKDIVYAPPEPATSQGHLLDLYLPVASERPAPLVIWSHGSGWLAENGRIDAELVAAQLTPHSFAVAGVAVRSSEHAQFPAQLYDIKHAIRWLRANAQHYRLDPAYVGIMGESSGGWLAAMAGLTGDMLEFDGDMGGQGQSSRVQAVIPFYPPTDFLQMDAHMLEHGISFNRDFGLSDGHADPRSPESRLMGYPLWTRPNDVQRANPISYATRNAPPFLIVHGQRDLFVPYHQSELLYQALSAVGADVTLIMVPRGEHGQWHAFLSDTTVTMGALAHISRNGQSDQAQLIVLNWGTVIDFLAKHLRNPHA